MKRLEQIKTVEAKARQLHTNGATRARLNALVTAYGDDFLDATNKVENRMFVGFEDAAILAHDFEIKGEGDPLETILEEFDERITQPGLNPASGGHLAYIPGGGVYPTALGDYLASTTNKYAGVYYAAPGAVKLENDLIRWMCGLMGYPKTALGNLTSGGSIANLIAVATARDAKGVTAEHIRKSVIYMTAQAHHSAQKAIRIVGLNECPLRYIPMDANFRMDAAALKAQVAQDAEDGLKPFLLIGSAGTTDVGAVDPMDALADVAEAYNMWFHVDAAYGGFFILMDELKPKFKGIERSDSITIDPHKGLFIAYGTGAVLVRDVEALNKTNFYQASYMQDTLGITSEFSPAELSPELTKHFRGLRMWLPLRLFGLNAFKAAVAEKAHLCQYFYEEIQELGFEVGPTPELSVAIYRYTPSSEDANAFNQRLVEYVKADGRVFLSSTTLDGVFWIRLAVLSFRTHLDTVDTCLAVLKAGVEELEAVTVS